jgi:CRISPR/Cas system-associated exonuclease Cas4 (RecB family)
MRTLRASEVSTYLFCQRAWWYQRNGQTSENISEMASGSELHRRHGRAVLGVGCLRLLAYALLLSALVIFTIYLAERFILP